MSKPAKPPFNLERELIDQILKAHLSRAHLLVGVSGGADSVALGVGLARVRNRLKDLKITWAHIHHGTTSDLAQRQFRDEALRSVQAEACRQGVPCVSARVEDQILVSGSEDQFRRARYDRLRVLAQVTEAEKIVLGHTQADVLETRLLRLIRGVGPKGLTAMAQLQGNRFRPMLNVSRPQIEGYLQALRVTWLDDPSNQNPRYARNELRRLILRPVQERRPLWVNGLRRSLSRIASDLQHYDQLMAATTAPLLRTETSGIALDRSSFSALDPRTQCGVLVQYLRLVSVSHDDPEWTRDQIEEVRKRCHSRQKNFEFSVGARDWSVNSDTISIQVPASQK